MSFTTFGIAEGADQQVLFDAIAAGNAQVVKAFTGAEGDSDIIATQTTLASVLTELQSQTIATGTRHAGSLTPAGIGAAHAVLLNPAAAIHSLKIRNFTDGDIIISLDAGSTDHWALGPGEEFEDNYGSNGLELSDVIHIKDGTNAPANGVVYAVAYSG